MATLGDILLGAASFSTSLLGTAEQQRDRQQIADDRAERKRQFEELAQIRRDAAAELKQTRELQYGVTDLTPDINAARAAKGLPPIESPIRGRAPSLPAIIQSLSSDPRYQTVGELQDTGILTLPPVVKAGIGPERGELGPPEVSEPYTGPLSVSVPDTAAEAARRKVPVHPETVNYLKSVALEQAKTERERKQNESNAKYQMYTDSLVSGGTPFPAARGAAAGQVFQETGIWPSVQHVPAEPKAERAANLEQSAVEILAKPEAAWSAEDRALIAEYRNRKSGDLIDVQIKEARLRIMQEQEKAAKARSNGTRKLKDVDAEISRVEKMLEDPRYFPGINPDVDELRNEQTQRLRDLYIERKDFRPAGPSATPKPGEPKRSYAASLPDPKTSKGKWAQDRTTGIWFESDGMKWVERGREQGAE